MIRIDEAGPRVENLIVVENFFEELARRVGN